MAEQAPDYRFAGVSYIDVGPRRTPKMQRVFIVHIMYSLFIRNTFLIATAVQRIGVRLLAREPQTNRSLPVHLCN